MAAEDLRQVLALLADYARTLDEGDFEEHLELYAQEGRLRVFGREWVGREAIGGFMAQAHRGHHLTGVPRVEFAGERARARSDFVFFREDLRLYSAGRYDDELVKVHGEWKIATRDIQIRLRAKD